MTRLREAQALEVTAPERGKCWRFPSEATSKVYETPANWLGKYILWEAEEDGSFQFGSSTDVAVTDPATDSSRGGSGTAGTPYTLTVASNTGKDFTAGEPMSWLVEHHHKYFAVITPTPGDIEVTETSKPL